MEVNILGDKHELPLKTFIELSSKQYFESQVSWYLQNLEYNHCLEHCETHAVRGNGGESYVYLWKRAYGYPFYVGSGNGRRWLNINRNVDFYNHVDNADAIVYKLLVAVDRETAYECEKFVGLFLTLNGIEMANKDNNIAVKEPIAYERAKKEYEKLKEMPLMKKVEDLLLSKVLIDDKLPYEAAIAREKFLKNHGEHYFSSLQWKSA